TEIRRVEGRGVAPAACHSGAHEAGARDNEFGAVCGNTSFVCRILRQAQDDGAIANTPAPTPYPEPVEE
ncbi:MAG: hypothetical protein QGH07_10630, partial [Alphaproteobacteria bacterium]|nr:hypothetical protein [Alphaproteobacteria bacterium]